MSNHVNEEALERCYEEAMGISVDELMYKVRDIGNDHDYQVLLKIVSDVAEELFVERAK